MQFDANCRRCARLAGFLDSVHEKHPDYFAKPVPSFGAADARFLIVGLAPGLHGANRSGRPFYMDASGEWLYGELERRGLWDGEKLDGVYILNAVKCVPPKNRPSAQERERCRPWLAAELDALVSARVVLALGGIAHAAVLRCWDALPISARPFGHGALHRRDGGRWLADSYHCSRYNTSTGRLTTQMFGAVFAAIRSTLDGTA